MRRWAAWRAVFVPFVVLMVCVSPLCAQKLTRSGVIGDREIEASSHWLESIDLPEALPESFQARVPLGGETVTIDVQLVSVRGQGYGVRVQREDGRLVPFEADAPRTYQGRVLERPSSSVAVSLLSTGLRGVISFPGEPLWVIEPLSDYRRGAARESHVVTLQLESPFDRHRCGTDLLPPPPETELNGTPPEAFANDCNRVAEIAWDADFETYQFQGSDVNNVLADIDAVTNAMEVAYARDTMIRHLVGHVIVRTAEPDPYSGSDAGVVLGQFQNEWTTNQAGIQRDAVHLATGRGVMDGGIIGLAYVGAMCSFNVGFGLSLFANSFGGRVAVTAHELGHNWSAPHCWDPDFCGIMCGGCKLQFGPVTRANILSYRNSRGCLDVGPGSLIAVPPNTVDDSAVGDGPTRLDLLANDYDGNCDTVIYGSWDPVTEAGGEVLLSPGSGPGGRDELLYLPPRHYIGPDSFEYIASDGNGGETPGQVSLQASDTFLDLTLRFSLDETSGSTVTDTALFGPNGQVVGNPARGEGGAAPATGSSVRFDGIDDAIRVDGRALTPMNDVSLAFWIWIEDAQAGFMAPLAKNDPARAANDPWTVQVRQKGSGESPGTRFLRWITAEINGGSQILQAEVPVDQFAHVVITHDGSPGANDDVARIYVNGALIAEDTGYEGFSDTALADLELGNRLGVLPFRGRLDDVQVYDAVLDGTDVTSLFANPGAALLDRLAIRFGLDELGGKVAYRRVDGYVEGGASLGQPGAAPGTGSAIGFDGVDDRVVVNGGGLTSSRDHSLVFWVFIDSSNTGTMIPLSKKDPARSFSDPWTVQIQSTGSGELPGTRNLQWFTTSHSFILPAVVGAVPVDQWAQVALTLDRGVSTSVTRLYVNGVLVDENLNAAFLDDSPNADLELGARLGASFFQGSLDDLQIYDEALRPGEVLRMFQNPGSVADRPGLRRL